VLEHKSAISLKRVKTEEKLLWKAYRKSPTLCEVANGTIADPLRPPLPVLPNIGVRNPHSKLQSLLSQERVKLRTSNFGCTFTGSIGKTPIKNFGKSSRGPTQGLFENFPDTHMEGASRGHLCGSSAFLYISFSYLLMYAAHYRCLLSCII